MSRENDVYVYVIAGKKSGPKGPVKVGIAGDVGKRIRGIQTSCPFDLAIVHAFAFPEREMAREIERCFHEMQTQHRTSGEWFALHPIDALFLMTLCIEASFAVRMPGYEHQETIDRLCGLNDAREKLAKWTTSRGTLQ